jgi:glycosyltransferase involved in cell wall biosynthesis
MRRIRKRANIIITDSEFSKREIVELYGIKPEKIKVIYLGYDRNKFKKIEVENRSILLKYKIDKPYILYLGRIEKKKNVANMIHAFALSKDKHSDLKLVLAGGSGFDFDAIRQIIIDLKLEQEIIIPGYIDEVDLPQVIASAEVFLFPTFYEGFGLPIIQAMACQTPVVTSDLNPHKEVAGDAALLADPKAPQAIADKINSVLEDDNLRQELIQKGIEKADEFSWNKTAQSILALMK